MCNLYKCASISKISHHGKGCPTINQARWSIGITINRIAGHMKIQQLLTEIQALTEELQVQSEELQVQSEELKTFNEKLEEQYKQSEQKTVQLMEIQKELEDKARQLALVNPWTLSGCCH